MRYLKLVIKGGITTCGLDGIQLIGSDNVALKPTAILNNFGATLTPTSMLIDGSNALTFTAQTTDVTFTFDFGNDYTGDFSSLKVAFPTMNTVAPTSALEMWSSNDNATYTQILAIAPVSLTNATIPFSLADFSAYQMIVATKAYIDSSTSKVKAYADAAVKAMLDTNSLTSKLTLLDQINTILDGDAATAGFQAWQKSIDELNGLKVKISNFSDDLAAFPRVAKLLLV